ncbi:MAG TPA: DEAD/DEAH box helicase, partial [Polyangiaceae bacterium]
MTAFDRLTGAVQYQILNTLGFSQLRPVQEQSIDAILDGNNCVVLAPTAGGKTEAAFFPILSAMDAGDWKPVSVLYLSPIRALLNNQEARIGRYAETIGRRVFKWHGDTTPGPRKAFLKDPADILLTTPESLEAMLMSPNVSAARLFAGLRAVIIDEIHAFAG